MDSQESTEATLVARLESIFGEDNVLTGEADREFYATDVFRAMRLPVAVVRPANEAQVAELVRFAGQAGIPLVVRGGGASYTDAYAQVSEGGVTLDFSRMTRIDIDEVNATVTVEPGVTWKALYEAVSARGLRTTFWGSYSGLHATVAGSMSMHALSHGQGVSAEAAISFRIVTGTGETLVTGSAINRKGSAFLRFYGPDLTGLFTGDCGVLGIKTAITLSLYRKAPAYAVASFDFPTFEALHAALRETAQTGVVEEHFGLNAALQQGQIGKADAGAKVDMAKAVMRSSKSLGSGARKLAKMALGGEGALRAATYAGHFTVEGVSEKAARENIACIRRICTRHGEEVPATVPEVVRAMPFAPFHNVLGPRGERWLPLHCQLAHDRALPFHRALQAYWDSERAVLDRHGIWTGAMFMAVRSSAFLYEPTFYWPDARNAYHRRMVPSDYLTKLPTYPPAPEAEAQVLRMRENVKALMHEHGGVHHQVGRSYPYLEDHDPAHLALVRAIKRELDPHHVLNPGALGLQQEG